MTSKLEKTQARSLVAIDRELDLAAINAKRNKDIRCRSRPVDPRPIKSHQRRVQIVENFDLAAMSSNPARQSRSIMKSSTVFNQKIETITFRSPILTTRSDCITSVGNTFEQQTTFIDELFGVWTQNMQNIKAAMPFDKLTIDSVLRGRNSASSLH